jgi:putative tricarboxylic transport membrane protein
MAWDDVTLCVQADGAWKDLEALVDYARKNPGVVKFGSDQRLNSSQLAYELMQKALGVDMNYVQYDSSGDVAGALMGGHVDVGILNPGECVGLVKAGKLRPIITFSPERIYGEQFKDVPTFAEKGYPEIVYREFRGLAGAKDMPPEALKYYEDMCSRIVETDQWKEIYIKANSLTSTFMSGDEANEYAHKLIIQTMETFKEVLATGDAKK